MQSVIVKRTNNKRVMDFKSMMYGGKLDRDEIATLCELYANGATITELGIQFGMRNSKVYEYLRLNYLGIYPKFFTYTINLPSKMNDDSLFFDQ
jgi:hypothetical protein